jgi:hypothetical protein
LLAFKLTHAGAIAPALHWQARGRRPSCVPLAHGAAVVREMVYSAAPTALRHAKRAIERIMIDVQRARESAKTATTLVAFGKFETARTKAIRYYASDWLVCGLCVLE